MSNYQLIKNSLRGDRYNQKIPNSLINTNNLSGNLTSLINLTKISKFSKIKENDLNEVNKFIDLLSFMNCSNSDDKILNRAVCVLSNKKSLTLSDLISIAEEIYSSKFFLFCFY